MKSAKKSSRTRGRTAQKLANDRRHDGLASLDLGELGLKLRNEGRGAGKVFRGGTVSIPR
jgi:hypothetical protein